MANCCRVRIKVCGTLQDGRRHNGRFFRRLSLSDDDREAREEAETSVRKEFVDFFGAADEVHVTDKAHGVQGFSARFDLTKKVPENPDS
jgi:hypothetical protein